MSSHDIVNNLPTRPEKAHSCQCFEVAHQGVSLSVDIFYLLNKICVAAILSSISWTCPLGTYNSTKKSLVIFLFIERSSRNRLSRWPALRHRSPPFVKEQCICNILLSNAQVCACARRFFYAYQCVYVSMCLCVDESSCYALNVTPPIFLKRDMHENLPYFVNTLCTS